MSPYMYACELPDAVRRQLFWLIKRHTSYTAWARAFDAYERLFRKMESLLPELANNPLGTYGLLRDPYRPKPFDIWPYWHLEQERYRGLRAALARLRKGDKSVLGDDTAAALPIMARHAQDLLQFFQGEHPMDGYCKYLDPTVPEKEILLALALEAYSRAYENIKITGTPKWLDGVYCELNYSPESGTLVSSPPVSSRGEGPGYKNIFTRYPIPVNLPPVPEPVILPEQNPPFWAPRGKAGPLILQTGENIPVPGIYLSEPYGMIHYLATDTPAPELDAGGEERELACAWSLIWPDTRYTNGADIPEEEKLYFPDDDGNERKL